MERVAQAVQELGLPLKRLEALKTAVAEAALNAMEHGHEFQAELPVEIQVRASDTHLSVRIKDQGRGEMIPTPEVPDLEAKLQGRQSPRGWGLFLIKNLVDEVNITYDEGRHTVELIMFLQGDKHASQPT
jgi:anti-sigma regulatory factor (Ser/Thr protein kinase)